MAVYTFLESYDRTGKTLIPFSTSASGGFGRSLEGLAASATGAEILDGGPALHQRHPGRRPDPGVQLARRSGSVLRRSGKAVVM